MAKIYIGTSGFTYQHWRGIFYPQELSQTKWLEFYTQHFQTVEINASFYHQMSKKVYEGWAKRTPQDFVFGVKGSRFITHIKRLKDCHEPLRNFFGSVSGLGEKLGVVLWQLPPRWGADEKRLASFLSMIDNLRFKNIRHAFEFRDKSWLSPSIYSVLKDYNVALVIQDSPYWPTAEIITADFTYLRFHGRESLYGSCYNKEELKDWAEKIRTWQKANLTVYAFFNNDAHGYAVRNAKELKELLNC